LAKITPKTLLKKSSKVIDLDDVDISKYNFSIDDLDNEKSKNHDLLLPNFTPKKLRN
jgi:3-hexulose-6-phosphate synthase